MESTEHRLGAQHLRGCVALSRAANWNQNEADWRLMLGLGRGWGFSLADGTLIASTLVLPYGGRFAWISMVLVLPEHRGKGHASRLLRIAIAHLEERGLTPVLDATPAGREVYLRAGFRDCWTFTRHVFNGSLHKETQVCGLVDEDWNAALALDALAFGASRETVLRALAPRLPQLGPLVARDGEAASRLLEAGLARVPVHGARPASGPRGPALRISSGGSGTRVK